MRLADFDRIDVLDRAVDVLNATTVLMRGTFARRRRDGSEISRLVVTYLVTERPEGTRIAALMVRNPA